ncbi:hypothetical protein D4740_07395 [Actinomyces sp. 2119]|uniref:hypothetical protein n=1 Tax=Actinomyces sp. 2119 TaxID=2321393 RepID=UPI000E6CE609|nr:hypothetical protein [Actinomyces sp. 2119]RJF41895.1 hypothetical protein D4740_07395 [Actinomyces sp. 2119]
MPESADWKKVLLLSVLLGTASLVLNISFQEEIEGGWQTYSGFRKTGAKLVNSGSLWAALAFYCGSLTATPRAGALAGVLSAQCALGTHYTLGILTPVYNHSAMLANIEWFIAGAVLCCPLGVLGWLSQQRGALPLLARLVPAACVIADPIATQRLSIAPAEIPWSERYSDLLSGLLLLIAGLTWLSYTIYQTATGKRRAPEHPHAASLTRWSSRRPRR